MCWKRGFSFLFLISIVFLSYSVLAAPIFKPTDSSSLPFPSSDYMALNSSDIVPGRYLIEFYGAPLLERELTLSNQIDTFETSHSSLMKEGRYARAAKVERELTDLVEEREVLLLRQKKKIILEHERAIAEISNSISSGISITGSAVKGDFLAPDHEYYNTFNGALFSNLSQKEVDAFRQSPYIKNIYPDFVVKAFLNVSVPLTNASKVWNYDSFGQLCAVSKRPCLTGEGVKVAVLDTGVNYLHPDLGGCFGPGCKVVAGYDFANNDSDPMDDADDSYHGTHVAGTIAANRYFKINPSFLPQPFSYWLFDEVVWRGVSGEVKDSLGKNNGTASGAQTTSGFYGNAASFDGVDDSIIVPFSSDFNSPNFSVSVWVKAAKVNQQGGIFEKTVNGFVNTQYSLFIHNGFLYFRVMTSQGLVSNIFPLDSIDWTHIVVTYDGKLLKLYQNGILYNQISATGLNSGIGEFLIGSLGRTSPTGTRIYPFNGSIDEFRIFNKSLTSTDVSSLYVSSRKVTGTGLLGVAPNATLYAYKVLDWSGSGTWSTVIAGIESSIDPNGDGRFDDKVDIISMSLGGPGDPDDPVSQAVDRAVGAGVIAVIAAGNEGPGEKTIGSPGTARKAITVGAVNKSFSIAEFSSRGPVLWQNGSILKPDVVSVGVNINSLSTGSDYQPLSGTSMATPHVAGIAALIKQAHPDWTPLEVKMALRSGTRSINNANFNQQGYGFVDALRAVYTERPISIAVNTTGIISGIVPLTASVPINLPLASISLSYGKGTSPSTWIPIVLNARDVSSGLIRKEFDTFQLDDGIYTLKLQARGSGQNVSEDRSLFIVENNNISGIEDYSIYRGGEEIKLALTMRALRDSYPSFASYIVEYSLNTTRPEWKTADLMTCKSREDKTMINYPLASSFSCSPLPGVYDRLFVWNTSGIKEAGMYQLRLRVNFTQSEFQEVVTYVYIDPTLMLGWPQNTPPFIDGSDYAGNLVPILYDLDRDGDQEIIVNYGRNGYDPYANLMVYESNGSVAWNLSLGVEMAMGAYGTSSYALPVIGDFNKDKSPDIAIYLTNYSSFISGSNISSHIFNAARLYIVNATGGAVYSPISVPNDMLSKMVAGDIDNDGYDDLIIQNNLMRSYSSVEQILVVSKGAVVARWNLPEGALGNDEMTPALGNFDSDSDLEIVVLRTIRLADPLAPIGDGGRLYIYNKDGSLVSGWPQIVKGYPGFDVTPAVGDIDGDGKLEIIAGYVNISTSSGNIVAYHSNGSVVRGFPYVLPGIIVPPYNNWPVTRTPYRAFALGDFDGDGKLEIVVSLTGSYVTGYETHVIYSNGSSASGWPKNIYRYAENYGPIIADVDADGKLDVLATGSSIFPVIYPSYPYYINASNEGGIWAWHFNGSRINGFPKGLPNGAMAPPAVGDIDGDGKLELVGTSAYDFDIVKYKPKGYGSIHVWNLSGSYLPSHEQWLAFRKDSRGGACYDCSSLEQGATTSLRSSRDSDKLIVQRPYQSTIIFKDALDLRRLKKSIPLLRHISLERTRIVVNSSALPELNRSAQLIFSHLSFQNPSLLYNNISCPIGICQNSSYNNKTGTFIVNVTHFSSFEVIETPFCGDNQCQPTIGESCSVCSSDCGSCPSDSPTATNEGGGGGGGGGGGSKNRCISDWQCTLDACLDGKQVQRCVDANKCVTNVRVSNLNCTLPDIGTLGTAGNISEEVVDESKESNLPSNDSSGKLWFIWIGILGALGAGIFAAYLFSQYSRNKLKDNN